MAKQKEKNTENEASKVSKIHDAFFKSTFSFPEVAKTYIQKFMDNAINLPTFLATPIRS